MKKVIKKELTHKEELDILLDKGQMALNELLNSQHKIVQGFNDIFSEIINSDMLQPTFND